MDVVTGGATEQVEWVVIGGGFAGLATAAALAERRHGPGMVFEREVRCGVHASGRNAGIFRLAEHDSLVRALAWRSLATLRAWDPEVETPLLQTTGGLTLGGTSQADHLQNLAVSMQHDGMSVELLSMVQARGRYPELAAFRGAVALWCPDEGVVDVDVLLTTLLRRARRAGVAIQTGVGVDELLREGGRVVGVRADTREIRAQTVIDATGAWAGYLQRAWSPVPPLQAYRRHLFVGVCTTPWRVGAPFVWSLADEFYARREADGLLASPCDETSWTADSDPPPVDASMRERLAEKVLRGAPGLSDMTMRREWACLRTFAPDRRPLLGQDPIVPGLLHVSGLGGFGVTACTAIGEVAADLVTGRSSSWLDTSGLLASRFRPPDHERDAALGDGDLHVARGNESPR